ncbi:MAG: 4-alpha-glucanotransferase [Anaerorhabdus sp.]|uniref:4-alpha-glucanotransferase n=1 Tax=Anaerorhabdus sp. TaxID=1872524 RepID=UPI003A89DBBD
MRKAGLLLAISSLPSKYGVGDFGGKAFEFIDFISDIGIKIWQILPLNPLGYGNSPYQPYSSKALDELYIDLDEFVECGWIQCDDLPDFKTSSVDYQRAREYKVKKIKEAFYHFEKTPDYLVFIQEDWVYDYAVFISLKKQNEMRPWYEWSKEESAWIYDKQYDISHLEHEIELEMFIQYILLKQWKKLCAYAKSKGIKIMGDIPFYVGRDSLDVWSNQNCFLLDEDYVPTFVAGVPPDYFSVTGQRWGNPIYDWDYLIGTDFNFWVDRMEYASKLYDIVRIDHFRAFETYWKIPASCETAMEGEWIEAPGKLFFDYLLKKHPDMQIIAEDLGLPRKEVYELRDHFNFKGMKIVQFTFDPNETNNNFEDRVNMIIYTGTHDNQTIKGWFDSLEKDVQIEVQRLLKIEGYEAKNIVDDFCCFTLSSIAEIAILPMQDVLGLDDYARMNTPGTIGSPNWEWKLQDFNELFMQREKLRGWIKTTNR